MIARSQVAAAKDQTERQRQIHHDSAQPYVWLDIRPNHAQGITLDLVLGSSGSTVATDVRVAIDPPFNATPELTAAALQRLARGIASLPPGRTLT